MNKIMAGLILTAVFLFPWEASANSGPVYWQGYPSMDTLLIQEDSPIFVEKEDLTFDFSDDEYNSYTISGEVTADYRMVNPADQPRQVQMAFPLIGTLADFSAGSIEIIADGREIPFEVYPGNKIGEQQSPWQPDTDPSYDFSSILGSVTNEPYRARSFSGNEKGRLYTIDVRPAGENYLNFALDFSLDYSRTKVIISGFNRLESDDDWLRISARCTKPETLEIFVIGEDIKPNIRAYSDGELKEETGLYTYDISSTEEEIVPYLLRTRAENTVRADRQYLSEIQLANLYTRALDDIFQKNRGFCTWDDLLSQEHSQRIIVLVYNADFLADSTKQVSVKYRAGATMDQTKTSRPIYSFDYILNPAQNWSALNSLNIEIIPPESSPHIISSNISLERGEDNIYRASLTGLPENDLSFSFYASEEISFLDKVQGSLNIRFGYLAPLLAGAFLFLLILSGSIAYYFYRRSSRL